jgi:hypothetical protein
MLATDLTDARESLAYWEDRQRRLPPYAVRARREARDMAARWRTRVAQAERAMYGSGLLGTLLFLLGERRLPADTRHGARRVARRGAQAMALLTVTAFALMVLALATVVHMLVALLG